MDYDYIAILGPTASGKSNIAMKLAEYLPIEIVSVDSVSVYEGMDIGSAKPSIEDRKNVVHHLIDVADLTEVYTAARFVDDATVLIKDIKARGKIPVLCGGTMMYMSALSKGIDQVPDIPEHIQSEITSMVNTMDQVDLHKVLVAEDPVMGRMIHENDAQRTQRALAVWRATNKSLCDYWKSSESVLKGKHFILTIEDRDAHRKVIAKRVDKMLEMGLESECRALISRYGEDVVSHPAMRSIGYKEMSAYICGTMPRDEVREKIVVSTAQFVKRQMTWLRSWDNAENEVFIKRKDQCFIAIFIQAVIASVR